MQSPINKIVSILTTIIVPVILEKIKDLFTKEKDSPKNAPGCPQTNDKVESVVEDPSYILQLRDADIEVLKYIYNGYVTSTLLMEVDEKGRSRSYFNNILRRNVELGSLLEDGMEGKAKKYKLNSDTVKYIENIIRF